MDISKKIAQQVQQFMAGIEPGHDFAHVWRVRNNALKIQQTEGGDALVIELAALLHEIGDSKFFEASTSLPLAESWMTDAGVAKAQVAAVMQIVTQIGFSKQLEKQSIPSIEMNVVQDADRLEAIGAIGIARTFSYGAAKQRPFFLEDVFPVTHTNSASYRQSISPTVNHFFEKLFLLKDLMLTQTGLQLALERHQVVYDFLLQFFDEVAFDSDFNKQQWLRLLQTHKP